MKTDFKVKFPEKNSERFVAFWLPEVNLQPEISLWVAYGAPYQACNNRKIWPLVSSRCDLTLLQRLIHL